MVYRKMTDPLRIQFHIKRIFFNGKGGPRKIPLPKQLDNLISQYTLKRIYIWSLLFKTLHTKLSFMSVL